MKKREFLAAALGAAALPAISSERPMPAAAGPALLTVTGAIGRGNRGPLNPALDQMMHKQHLAFERAYAFDFAALAAMPAVSIAPTLEYDSKPHRLAGPLLIDVAKAAGAQVSAGSQLILRAVDGYAVAVSAADLQKYRFIVATHLDGQPMPLGGLGPLWAIYDADRFPDMLAKPLGARFALCPWALYHIDVRAA